MRRLSLLFTTFVLLVATSCEKATYDHNQYYVLWITATVVDEQGEPIEGIYAYPEGENFDGREGYTNYLGNIDASAHLTPRERWVVCFEDVDGYHNRGLYENTMVDITDKIIVPHKPDRWGYTGITFIEMGTIVLKRVAE